MTYLVGATTIEPGMKEPEENGIKYARTEPGGVEHIYDVIATSSL